MGACGSLSKSGSLKSCLDFLHVICTVQDKRWDESSADPFRHFSRKPVARFAGLCEAGAWSQRFASAKDEVQVVSRILYGRGTRLPIPTAAFRIWDRYHGIVSRQEWFLTWRIPLVDVVASELGRSEVSGRVGEETKVFRIAQVNLRTKWLL